MKMDHKLRSKINLPPWRYLAILAREKKKHPLARSRTRSSTQRTQSYENGSLNA
jgi:hypothetical protein